MRRAIVRPIIPGLNPVREQATLGRRCWITKIDGKMAFGDIHQDVEDAARLTDEEIITLASNPGVYIEKVTP